MSPLSDSTWAGGTPSMTCTSPLCTCSTRWLSSGDEPEDDLVEVRLAGLPVVGVAGQRDHRALLLPALEHERAGPDRVGEELLLGDAVEVLGQDGVRVDREVGEQRRPRLRERDLDGPASARLDVLDGEVEEAHGAGLARACAVERPGHVVGRHGLAVGEHDAVLERERVVMPSVLTSCESTSHGCSLPAASVM